MHPSNTAVLTLLGVVVGLVLATNLASEADVSQTPPSSSSETPLLVRPLVDANFSSFLDVANQTSQTVVLRFVLFVSAPDASSIHAIFDIAEAYQRHIAEKRIYLGRTAQFAWASCPSEEATKSEMEQSEYFACRAMRDLSLDSRSLPHLVVFDELGLRRTSWEKMSLLQFPKEAAALALRIARTPLRQIYSLSDAEALVAALVDADSSTGVVPVIIFVVSPRAPLTVQKKLADISEYFVGNADVFLLQTQEAFDELVTNAGLTLDGCEFSAINDARCAQEGDDGASCITAYVARRRSVRQKASASSCRARLHQAAMQAHQQSDSAWTVDIGMVVLQELVHVPCDLPSQVDECTSSMYHSAVQQLSRSVFDDVSVATPINRDLLLHRSPRCSVVYFVPNLFNASIKGIPPFTLERPKSTLSSHVPYYLSRLKQALVHKSKPSPLRECVVTLLDPSHHADLFRQFGFRPSEVYQTTSEIRSQGGKSFSGKARDNLIAVSINNTWRIRYDQAYFDVALVESFLTRMLALKSSKAIASRSVMRSAIGSGELTGMGRWSAPCCGALRWSVAQACVGQSSGNQWQRVQSQWLRTTTFDQAELYLSDLSRDTVFILVHSVHNASARDECPACMKVERAIALLVNHTANIHPSAHLALQFVRLGVDNNDIPEPLLAHLPPGSEPLQLPYAFYLSRDAKLKHRQKHPRNPRTDSLVGTQRPSASATLTDADREGALPIPMVGITTEGYSEEEAALRLQEELRKVSLMQWLFDTPFVVSRQNQNSLIQNRFTSSVEDDDEF